MNTFCENCGAQTEDTDEKCQSCGKTIVRRDANAEALSGAADVTNKKKSATVLIIGAVLVIGLIAVAIFAFSAAGSRGYNGCIDSLCKTLNTGDTKYMKSTYGDTLYTMLMESENDPAEALESSRFLLEEQFGEDYKVSYKVISSEKLSEDIMYIWQIPEDDIKSTDGYLLTVEFTVEGELGDAAKEIDVYAMKMNGDRMINTYPSEIALLLCYTT